MAENNAGNITPEQATQYAEEMNVKVYTVLMGPKPGSQPQKRRGLFGRVVPAQQFPVNPELLKTIADRTGGSAYIASDRRGLEENFEEILAALEKSAREDVAAVHRDANRPMLAAAFILILLEFALRLTRLREFP